MANGGYLVPPSEEPKGSQIWEETWKRVDRFLPNLFTEIFPEPKQPPPSQTVSVDQKAKDISLPPPPPPPDNPSVELAAKEEQTKQHESKSGSS